MKGLALGLSLSIAFILGCAVAPFIVPRMSAQQQTDGIQRWEYTCPALARTGRQHGPAANELGAQGWEFSHMASHYYCFKRPL